MTLSRYRQILILIAPLLLFLGGASAAQIVSCRGQRLGGSVEFLDAKGRTVKSFGNSDSKQSTRKGDMTMVTINAVRVYGCQKGKFAYVVRYTGTCVDDDDQPCNEDEIHVTLEIYDHTGKQTWKSVIPVGESDDEVVVARSDERVLFSSLTPPYGIYVVDPQGVKKIITFEGGLRVGIRHTDISPNGRYGVAETGLHKFAFFDADTGKIHTYEGPGHPWVNDEGRFEVWVGSSLKDDWSLGPDGKKVYEFKFE